MNQGHWDRFWAKVEVTDGCWLWRGSLNNLGYGQVRQDSRCLLSHRVAYEWLVGPIPEGLVIDHLCRTPACLNPIHLEPVTQKINIGRADVKAMTARARAVNSGKTHCPQGHPRTSEHLYVRPDGHGSFCRTCAAARKRRVAA